MEYKNIRSILLISLSCIGDVLLTTPVMKSLKDNFPGASLTVVAGPTVMPVVKRHELVNEAISFDNKHAHKGTQGNIDFIRTLRRKKYDLVVDLRNSAIPYFLRARYRITAHEAHMRNKDVKGRHAIDRHLDVLTIADISVTTRTMSVTIPGDITEKVVKTLTARDIDMTRMITICPGAGSLYKQYDTARFAAALHIIAQKYNAQFIISGGPSDQQIAESLISYAKDLDILSFAGQLDILECGALTRLSRLVITNDSGPMHLSAAVGTPTIALFGPTDAQRYGPRGNAHRIIWHREECNPCKSADCGKISCVNLIEPEIIAKTALEMLNPA